MEEQLGVLAEISVGLVGFSSIVVVFRRRSSTGAWKPEDAFRFKLMLEAGLAAGLFAILPAAIMGLGVPPNRLWPSLCALLLGYELIDLVAKRRQLARLPRESLSRVLNIFVGIGKVCVMVVQVLSIADWLVPRGPGAYVFGVTWLTVYSGLTFYRLATAPLVISTAGAPPDD